MSNKNLKFFMREAVDEIITVPGLECFKDDKGEIIPLEIKVLSQEEIQKITKAYEDRRPALDKRGNPVITAGGEVAFKTKRDNEKWVNHLIVEALVTPDLKAQELKDHYGCVDNTEMPLKVFRKASEYQYVVRKVMSALGLGSYDLDDDDIIEEAKN